MAEDLTDLPWWSGVSFAAVAVGVSLVLSLMPANGPLLPSLVHLLQWILWILAGAVLVYSGVVVPMRALGRRSFDWSSTTSELDPYAIERYISEYYRGRGFAVIARGGRRSDGGLDLSILRGDERLIVQWKHWKARRVGARRVREVWGLVDHEKASGGVLVTCGVFTEEARSFAVGKRLELIDGTGLARLVADVRSTGVRVV